MERDKSYSIMRKNVQPSNNRLAECCICTLNFDATVQAYTIVHELSLDCGTTPLGQHPLENARSYASPNALRLLGGMVGSRGPMRKTSISL